GRKSDSRHSHERGNPAHKHPAKCYPCAVQTIVQELNKPLSFTPKTAKNSKTPCFRPKKQKKTVISLTTYRFLLNSFLKKVDNT
ncbi:MAG: hypothetical protein KJ588_05320, partial [Gammaproteobacteria bacterium]|nr:hypothetical protein [Gammaproteobacteria bacterium]